MVASCSRRSTVLSIDKPVTVALLCSDPASGGGGCQPSPLRRPEGLAGVGAAGSPGGEANHAADVQLQDRRTGGHADTAGGPGMEAR